MNEMLVGLAATAVPLCLLTGLAIWARRRAMLRASALALGTAVAFVGFSSAAQLLSLPKPVSLEWWQRTAEEATVLEGLIVENTGIYLWLQLPDEIRPKAYVMEWDRELAEQLQEAMREAEKQGTKLKMRLPFEPSLDNREPKFHAMPVPAMPRKKEPEAPQIFEQET